MVAQTEGPFEYYDELHAGVTGDTIRETATQPEKHAADLQALGTELEGDEKQVTGQIEGDIVAGTRANATEVKSGAYTLAAKGLYASGLIKSFAAMVDTFDTTVNSLNTQVRSSVASSGRYAGQAAAQATPKQDFDPVAYQKQATASMKAFLMPQYKQAEGKLDNDADDIATKFSQGPKNANLVELIRAGLIPLTSASLFPGLVLTDADKIAAYQAAVKGMTPQQQAAYVMAYLHGPHPKGAPPIDPDLVKAIGPDAQKLLAADVANDIKSQDITPDTVNLMAAFSDQHPFAYELYQNVTPDQLSDAIQKVEGDAYPNGHESSSADDDKVAFYKQFLTAAGTTFATYTKGTGAYQPPADLEKTYYDAITSDHHGEGAALTLMLRAGGQETSYDPHFIGDLSKNVYDWERSQDGKVWGPRDPDLLVNPFNTNDDHYTFATDGLANLLGAMHKSPEAAQDFFSDGHGGVDQGKIDYLIGDNGDDPSGRTFSRDDLSDEGDGLGLALEAACAGENKNDFSATLTSDVFQRIADQSGKDGGGFGPDAFYDGWHAWPDMTDSLGTIAASYRGDVYDLVHSGASPSGPGHLDINGGDFDKVLGEIGRGDKTGIETLSASVMMEGNSRISDEIQAWKADHPGQQLNMETLGGTDLGQQLQGISGDNGQVLGHILNKSVIDQLDDEDKAAARAEYTAKAIDIAGGFIPGGGTVLGEGASELAKSAYDVTKGEGLDLLKDAVANSGGATTADQYVHQSAATTSETLKNNVLNQLIGNGYLGDQHQGEVSTPQNPVDHSPAIPASLLVTGPDGKQVINPGLYDNDKLDTIGAPGQYTDAQVAQMRDDWIKWQNSAPAHSADGITNQAWGMFNTTVNSGS